jgi:hypothetical protein
MISQTFKITTKGSANPEKQVAFGTASALTLTGKEIQIADKKALHEAFTIRTRWDEVGPYAVKTQAAKKTDWPRPTAIVGTAADFIEKFLRGPAGSIEIKLPHGNFIAIPTTNVRRTKRDIIRAAQRPRNLRGKRDIVLPMRSGKGFVLFQEQGRGKSARRVALYLLVRQARIREVDPLFGPAEKVFIKRFGGILQVQIRNAFATAR